MIAMLGAASTVLLVALTVGMLVGRGCGGGRGGPFRALRPFLEIGLSRASLRRAKSPGRMWEISQETCVAAAHQLRFAPGEGERLHGHNWRIKAVLRASELDKSGWVVDFNHLGKVLRDLVEPYEHVFLNEVAPFDDVNPTAENIARVIADDLAAKMDDERVRVARVEVWENDTCCAVYFRMQALQG